MRNLPKGVKATSGGTFNPNDPLTYFIAGSVSNLELARQDYVLIAVNEISSKAEEERLDKLLDERKVMLDSGIFNLAMSHARKHEVTHDVGLSMPPEEIDGFEQLWDRYGYVTQKYGDRLWGMVELDQGGVEHKPRTRARIEDEFGVVPIPVYHPLLDGWDYYDDLAREYDRMCFGNLVKASPPVRLRLQWTATQRAKEYPYLWTHLLGVTPNQNLIAMGYKGSCDSSSWITSLRWMPSWRGFAMLSSLSGYPIEMWYGTDNYDKALQMASTTTYAQELIIRALKDDSHPWLHGGVEKEQP